MGNITLRNVVVLKKNIDHTFKREPNYKIKKAKLESLDQRRNDIASFIHQIDKFVNEEEPTFFRVALDDELIQIIHSQKVLFNECQHNLIEAQKQIIEYLNQIQHQSRLIEKLRQVKYLKDQFTINQDTNLLQLLATNQSVLFETRSTYPLKLSLDYLREDEALESIRKVALKRQASIRLKLPVAPQLPTEWLEEGVENEIQVNLEEVKNSFIASGNDLFNFVLGYPYDKPLSFDEQVTLYCQLISLYEDEFNFTDTYAVNNDVEYCMVYPKSL